MASRRLRFRLASFFAKIISLMSTEIPSPIPFLDDALNTDVIIVTNLAHTPQHIAAVRQYRIVQVAWLKESRSVEHEALQFFIQDPADNSHRTYWLLADRVGRPRPSPNSSVTSLEDAVASGKQLVNLSSSVPAHDRITISATSTATDSDYQTISTLELPKDAQLSLSNILALLYSVSKSSELYHIFDKNCYWFARSVYKAIQLASPGSVETKSSSRRTGYLGRIPITPEVTSDSDVVQTIISAWKIKMGECNGLKTTEEVSTGIPPDSLQWQLTISY